MQAQHKVDYETLLHETFHNMDDMLKAKAARVSEYLFMDLRRPAPHLRRPDATEKQMRVAALLSVFAGEPEGAREDELAWCHPHWKKIETPNPCPKRFGYFWA